ncbi:TetR/AcrR family transcriptional regulator [Corynebacterium hindlerae]|uniref:TetR/AcrR family transcriptional regulator n=1 Tax=Corynebacterium hindlerae TaxID=699041 RepID=A0A7G5FFE6_9CORY|nr:TetR/AcrR family transcriptional regulator [Corynebacterium hindlerae]QMV85337.1 TetR/AcrR family transcriptional regulator [Corynebacterium hindlerae]
MPRVSDADLNERRREILVGARKCFAEHGYEGATVRLLEEATGKSRGAIFHHFADKETLFLEIGRQDALQMAETVAEEGLVQVMRDMLADPDRFEWLSTRLEITRLLRTDAAFRDRWQQQQAVLDDAVRRRLKANADAGTMRTDVDPEVLYLFLETMFDGLTAKLASGAETAQFSPVLDLVEASVRRD